MCHSQSELVVWVTEIGMLVELPRAIKKDELKLAFFHTYAIFICKQIGLLLLMIVLI